MNIYQQIADEVKLSRWNCSVQDHLRKHKDVDMYFFWNLDRDGDIVIKRISKKETYHSWFEGVINNDQLFKMYTALTITPEHQPFHWDTAEDYVNFMGSNSKTFRGAHRWDEAILYDRLRFEPYTVIGDILDKVDSLVTDFALIQTLNI